jgi:hypothetical protein
MRVDLPQPLTPMTMMAQRGRAEVIDSGGTFFFLAFALIAGLGPRSVVGSARCRAR